VRVLDALAGAGKPQTASQMARQLAMPTSTVNALCATLAQMGVIKRLQNRAYELGYRVMDWTYGQAKHANLPVEFVRLWDSMGWLPEETGALAILDGSEVVYVACRNGSRPLELGLHIGRRLPSNCTAAGKALLSCLAPEQLRALGHSGGFRRLTAKSIADPKTLSKQLAQVRRQGYAIEDEESRQGLLCVAAPVVSAFTGEALAAVAVGMVKTGLDRRQKERACTAVRQLAQALSETAMGQGNGNTLAASPVGCCDT
jgi:DNA-binding IclR family transcriptional regulator